MNTNERLSQRLKEWNLRVPRDQGFKPGVWRRIADEKRHAGLSGLARTRSGLIGAACAVSVLLSGWSGHAYARSQAQNERETLAESYLANLDARSHTGLHR